MQSGSNLPGSGDFRSRLYGSTPLKLATDTLHELYTTLTNSGFTESQACKILGIMLAENAGNSAQNPEKP